MLTSEVGDLLALDAGLNRYASAANTDTGKAVAWHAVISMGAPGMTFEEARAAIVEHYGNTDQALTPYDLVEAWKRAYRITASQIEGDNRSAKNRGILARDWPDRQPMPPEAAARLAEARANSNAVAVQAALPPVNGVPWTIRELGQRA